MTSLHERLYQPSDISGTHNGMHYSRFNSGMSGTGKAPGKDLPVRVQFRR